MKDWLRLRLGLVIAALLRWRSRPYADDPRPVLVVAPHADDETLGCGGLIARKAQRNEPVSVVFVTDSAGAPESGAPPDLAGRRRAEALAALAVLGVGPEQVTFLAAPDGRLNRLAPAEAAPLIAAFAALLGALRPAVVLVPYRHDGSSEHAAAVVLTEHALAAADLAPEIWEYPVWAWWNPRRLFGQIGRAAENIRLPLGALRSRKLAALACHGSQATGGAGSGLPAVLAALCTQSSELFFRRPS